MLRIKLQTDELIAMIRMVADCEKQLNRSYQERLTREILQIWLRKMAVKLMTPGAGNHSFALDRLTLLALDHCLAFAEAPSGFHTYVLTKVQLIINPACLSI